MCLKYKGWLNFESIPIRMVTFILINDRFLKNVDFRIITFTPHIGVFVIPVYDSKWRKKLDSSMCTISTKKIRKILLCPNLLYLVTLAKAGKIEKLQGGKWYGVVTSPCRYQAFCTSPCRYLAGRTYSVVTLYATLMSLHAILSLHHVLTNVVTWNRPPSCRYMLYCWYIMF